ncbi:hypothetical protein RclHR1_02340015 [Rhizophagus clarus]|uniref:P-loop containing nucleoside triphosphate hydrolase protein n=1 Tax=Rhizophagus clarus TaxID=94130 RepID=A0A2Z6RQL2_9GLOM|nr:hypothetical protein RclHR1_02340015 [Rhizophagus clarus]GET00296.1 P-loop containing nucleoside triphosphate hydrolase protein [Rhizophagus clarus]
MTTVLNCALNCILLENSFAFIVDVNETNTTANSKVEVGQLKIGHLKYLIWNQRKAIQQSPNDYDLMNLWKIDISKFKSDITEEQIKTEGEQLDPCV